MASLAFKQCERLAADTSEQREDSLQMASEGETHGTKQPFKQNSMKMRQFHEHF